MSWQFPTKGHEIRYLQKLKVENERRGAKYAQRVAEIEARIQQLLDDDDGNGGAER